MAIGYSFRQVRPRCGTLGRPREPTADRHVPTFGRRNRQDHTFVGLWLVYLYLCLTLQTGNRVYKVLVFHFNVAFSRLCNISRFDLVVLFRDTDLFFYCARHLEENIYGYIGCVYRLDDIEGYLFLMAQSCNLWRSGLERIVQE